ncbi:transposable element Tcb1 transposase [Trichonephila clavipes]|nr:transposable element Tcb1 transposase [Trichonephila clavipes]
MELITLTSWYTTDCDDRRIVCMTVMDCAATSRTTAQQIQSVAHHSVSSRTFRHRLKKSGISSRCPLLRLPMTESHKHLYRHWYDKRRTWTTEWSDVVFTEVSRLSLQHHDGWFLIWRNRGEKLLNYCGRHRYTGPVPGIMVWGGIGFHYCILLVRIVGIMSSPRYISEVLEPVVLPYIQHLPSAIFHQVYTRPNVAHKAQEFLFTHQIELFPWPACSLDLLPIGDMWSMLAQRLAR